MIDLKLQDKNYFGLEVHMHFGIVRHGDGTPYQVLFLSFVTLDFLSLRKQAFHLTVLMPMINTFISG